MGKFIIVYSTENNRDWQPANWRTVTEKDTIEEAHRVYDNYIQLALDKAIDYACRPNQAPITQVAIFRLHGKETFERKPLRYYDGRDKHDWPIGGAVSGK